ncbi:MAG: PfkB family carbohydrate kinase [Egibacteraceae bacterium]
MTGPLVVVGDALLDRDLVGHVERLCPDAPVPVVDSPREQLRPGGAGLAAYIAARYGGHVVLVTPLGDDSASRQLHALLEPHVEVVALPLDGSVPQKVRVRAGGHPLLRFDLGGGVIGGLTSHARAILATAEAVLISDYGYGTAAHPELRRALSAGRAPLVWDPHPKGPAPVEGARLATPNLDEALRVTQPAASGGAAAGERGALALAERCANALVRRWRAAAVAVTLGPRGALLSVGQGASLLAPAVPVAGTDSCGAGDCFAATAATALAGGALVSEAVTAAVRAASQYVAAGGAAALRIAEAPDPPAPPAERRAEDVVAATRAANGTVVATGGCFDLLHVGHINLLRSARALGDCLVVCLNSDASVTRLKGPDRPVNSLADRMTVLEALDCVDAVAVFDEDSPHAVLARLRPEIWVKGGDYAATDLPEAPLLASWGGQCLVLPYHPGHSSTRLLHAKRTRGSLDHQP